MTVTLLLLGGFAASSVSQFPTPAVSGRGYVPAWHLWYKAIFLFPLTGMLVAFATHIRAMFGACSPS
jgi:hypothetical protein